jgi:hypothetical protein
MQAALKIALLSIAFTCNSASATCWKVTDLKGSSARAAKDYAISNDGFSSRSFEISITDNSGSVSPSNMTCKPATVTSLVCVNISEEKLTLETWAIDESQKKIVHTKSISGYGVHDGGNLFIGKISGFCG